MEAEDVLAKDIVKDMTVADILDLHSTYLALLSTSHVLSHDEVDACSHTMAAFMAAISNEQEVALLRKLLAMSEDDAFVKQEE